MDMKKRKAAFFDIDGTIFRSSLLIELVEVLIANGKFPEKARKEFSHQEKKWLDRKADYEEYIMAVVKVFVKYIKGLHYGELLDASDIVFDLHKDKTYVYTKKLVADLKKRGFYLVAISQSPKTTIDPFAKRLGFNKVYGRGYELGPNDCFNGKVMDLHLIENKANIIKRVVEKENLTLTGSVGVGDTEGDITMLEMVDKPIAFNPNKKLYRYAKRAGWKIVVERKDVVYEID
jgi:HAD superfamily hydrolase (TIGR01490 family)